ncbi:hypothetical protein ACFSUS_21400 [Spirosoma soli]|uniref:Bacteriocin n=1 Tax=Spirosoma soli TaxID=1770529 RepID=A0ABW5M877_9BACT
MKLTINKLAISRRSIASLDANQLQTVQGGKDTFYYPTTKLPLSRDCAYLTVVKNPETL